MNHTFIFARLLKAGRAKVYRCPLPSHASVTHVMAKPITEDSKSHNAPCYPVSHIVQHLFGVSRTNLFLGVDLGECVNQNLRYVFILLANVNVHVWTCRLFKATCLICNIS